MFTICKAREDNVKKTNDFLKYFKSKWNEIHEENGVFRYKINNLQEKVVEGFLLQLNPDRCANRRQPEMINSVLQPFDKDKFNFTKVSPKEVLFTIKMDAQDTEEHSIVVNVSPISKFHSLLCPSLHKCLPQAVTEESLELAIKLMFYVGDRSFRVAFNSLCGLASVNHLHYHLFIEEHVLPVETAKCDHIQGPVYCLTKEYPVPAFCFEVKTSDSIENMAKEVYKLIKHLLNRGIAHNIFLTFGQSVKESLAKDEVLRILIWPRKSTVGVKQLTAFNVAVLELSGWFPVYNAEDFENLRRADLEEVLAKWKIDNFESLCQEIKELY